MTSDSKPLVTIGIPTYNRADGYLKDALESALAQTYSNIEIVVSDNGSSDNTAAVVKGYADERIRYFHQDPSIKPNDNFNFCLDQAGGSYFLLLHDDDIIDEDFVDVCMRAADYNTGIGIVRTGTRIIDSRGAVINQERNCVAGLPTADFFLGWFDGKTALYLCSTLFNTRYLKEIGGFRSQHNLFQDDIAEMRLAARFGRVDVEDIKASFRKHGGELTFSAKVRDWCEDSLELLEVMYASVPEKKKLIKSQGMRFFATINYNRATSIRPLGKRLAAIWLVFKFFEYRYLPPLWLLFASTALYRSMRYLKRKIKRMPEWTG